MKVLFVSNDSSRYGSNKSMINLIDELLKKNIEIYVLLPSNGPIVQDLKNRNVKYRIYKYFPGVGKENEKIKLYIKEILDLFIAFKISKWVRANKINIIHSVNSATFMGYYLGKINKIKHIWHIRELMKEDHNLYFFNKKIAHNRFDSADYLIYVSKSVKDKYDAILKNKNIKLIYNGIPIEKYKKIISPIVKNNKFKLLIAGAIADTKGQFEAIKAIEYLIQNNIKNIELQIAGEGPLQKYLKEYVIENNLSDKIKFIGFRDDLDEIRKHINICLMCSRNEAFGRVTVEAMMSRNLVIRF